VTIQGLGGAPIIKAPARRDIQPPTSRLHVSIWQSRRFVQARQVLSEPDICAFDAPVVGFAVEARLFPTAFCSCDALYLGSAGHVEAVHECDADVATGLSLRASSGNPHAKGFPTSHLRLAPVLFGWPERSVRLPRQCRCGHGLRDSPASTGVRSCERERRPCRRAFGCPWSRGPEAFPWLDLPKRQAKEHFHPQACVDTPVCAGIFLIFASSDRLLRSGATAHPLAACFRLRKKTDG